MIEEEDISAIKRKNRVADGGMLLGPGKDIDLDDDEDYSLMHDERKHRQFTSNNLIGDDDENNDMNKMKGVESDIEDLVNQHKKQNTFMAEKFKLFGDDEALDSEGNNIISEEASRIDTKENLIGPIKT